MYRLDEEEQKAAVELLETVVGINTPNPSGNEGLLAEYFMQYFSDTACSREITIIDPANNRSNVSIHWPGLSSNKILLLNGHLDTVPFGEAANWEYPPQRLTQVGDVLYGRGSCDMKGGLCAMAFALHKIARQKIHLPWQVSFLGTADEESTGLGALAAVKEPWFPSVQAVVIGEPTDVKLSLASKGALWLEMQLKGKTAHGAYPEKGANALALGLEITAAWQALLQKEDQTQDASYLGQSSLTLTQIQSGVKVNMIPDTATLTFDIRTLPGIKQEEWIEKMTRIAEEKIQQDARFSFTIEPLNLKKPVAIAKNHFLVQGLHTAQKRGKGSQTGEDFFAGTKFFSDGSCFAEANPALPIVLFGVGESDKAHQPDEYISRQQYITSIEILYDWLIHFKPEA